MPRKERKRPYAGQLDYYIGPDNTFRAIPPFGEPTEPEKEYKVERLVTFSDLEKEIYRSHKFEARDVVSRGAAVGAAIDWFLVPANFVYRHRDNYFFPEELYPDWDLETTFSNYYPTGYGWDDYLEILKWHRKKYVQENPLNPANLALERQNVKRTLFPLWNEAAKKFKVDVLSFQGMMVRSGNVLLPSGETVSAETVAQIGQRIVKEKFDALVDDDKDYSFFAKPGCMIPIGDYHLWVEADFVKNLRTKRKSVRERIKRGEKLGKRIMAKRIIGDFKDSDWKDLEDLRGPFAESMFLYNSLLSIIVRKIKLNQVIWARFSNGQGRRTFIIHLDAPDVTPEGRTETSLTFLRESGEEMFAPMPRLSQEAQKRAKEILERNLKRVAGVKT